ncbi:kynureninase [Entomospira culicis]|uniref:Kynureninase n=1 Tax=Entomospira culicis TaxID=2719989 RepID=A0A968GEV7_9SPIO|nr:kynureninase [Entomospira culicis]NIZ18767.1 kynureninase [Entomospira culicis]NIZ68982.1 kynureninase [Entomospira culicis]WDI37573.1 kynureninase [Entomospira culicis]WDI39201.1 kynureninase [Entomospira culicis]
MYQFKDDVSFAKNLDQQDPLAPFQKRFFKVENEIYMDGNSLGMASKDAQESLLTSLEDWKKEGIKIWNTKDGLYFNISRLIAKKTAPLLNADAQEIIATGTITANIHQVLATFYHPTKERYKIVVDELNFASDIYAVQSLIELKNLDPKDALITVKSRDSRTIATQDIIDAMREDVAIVWLPSVLYRSAQLLDMQTITETAHQRGILVGWDLAHSMGAIPHDFKAIDADFAVWCNYKYINGGPGASGGLYINKKHFGKKAGLRGWFGNKDATQFQLNHTFDQDIDANGWLIGTPNIFSLTPLLGALQIFEEAGIHQIRQKSLHITAYLMYLIDHKLKPFGYTVGNPREDQFRGGHVSLEHEEAYRISIALRDLHVIPDFREPNVIRLAPIALYNTYEEVYRVVEILQTIIVDKLYEQYSINRGTVV